jgi:signal transduction histidine kinase
MSLSRKRLAWLAGGLASVVIVGDAVLVKRALDGARAEERQAHSLVADRIFEELERELTILVETEEARSFLEYRYFFVPEGQVPNTLGLVRSPISDRQDDGIIISYFQVDPDGSLHNPQRPRDAELQVAIGNDSYSQPPGIDRLDQRLAELTQAIDWDAAPPRQQVSPPEPPQAQQRTAKQAVYGAVQGLNRYSRPRSIKQPQLVQTDGNSIANFANEQNSEAFLSQQSALNLPAPPLDVPLQSIGDNLVDVVISPIQGKPVGPDTLVLFRTVRVGADSYRQGLALQLSALQRHIEETVLQDSSIRAYTQIHWNVRADDWESNPYSSAAKYVFTHTFADPMASVSATVALSPIPAEVSGERRTILLLSAVLALVTVGGAIILYRTVNTELEFAERRNNFVAAVSHELKTPLTAIRMYSEMLQEGIVPSEEKRQQYYETITAESERLSRLINNVLELSQIEKDNREMSISVGSAGPILEQVAAILRPHVTQSGMTLRVTVEDGLPPVRVDADALSQVLVNLVDNAVKFSGTGEIAIEATRDGSRVRISVRDQGPGVPERQLAKIFEPFFRGERELTRRTKGTGIGLALVRGLVSGMGGDVSARNHPSGGLEVALMLAQG